MIACPICNKLLKQLHGTHIKKHNLTTESFKTMFPLVSLRNEAVFAKQQQKKQLAIINDNIKCQNCNALIIDSHRRQKRFCNSACAASFNNSRKIKDKKICIQCNKQYSTSCKHSKYCSHTCSSKARLGVKIDVECDNCRIFFPKKKSKINRSHRHFCTNTCKQIYYKNNPNERGVFSGHNGRSAIVSYRVHAFKCYEHKCYYCGYNKYEDVLQVHHLDKNRNNNNIKNLRIVCPTCHSEVHKNYLPSTT
jgi:hypothetical protein